MLFQTWPTERRQLCRPRTCWGVTYCTPPSRPESALGSHEESWRMLLEKKGCVETVSHEAATIHNLKGSQFCEKRPWTAPIDLLPLHPFSKLMDGCISGLSTTLQLVLYYLKHNIESNNHYWTVSTQTSESKCQLTTQFSPGSTF